MKKQMTLLLMVLAAEICWGNVIHNTNKMRPSPQASEVHYELFKQNLESLTLKLNNPTRDFCDVYEYRGQFKLDKSLLPLLSSKQKTREVPQLLVFTNGKSAWNFKLKFFNPNHKLVTECIVTYEDLTNQFKSHKQYLITFDYDVQGDGLGTLTFNISPQLVVESHPEFPLNQPSYHDASGRPNPFRQH